MKIQLFGENDDTVAYTTNSLADLFKELKRFDEAERYYIRALSIYRRIYSGDHIHTANVLNNLGDIYKLQRKYDNAEKYYKQALDMTIQLFGEHDACVAHTINSLVDLFRELKRFGETILYKLRQFLQM